MIEREELFALAAKPIGSPELCREADNLKAAQERGVRVKPTGELAETIKRTSKLWLPEGKTSANSTEARAAERELKALNYDLEDAVEAAGGDRGHLG
jgi:hypothetical protein